MSILFLLASLGVVNGILLGIYFLTRRRPAVADTYFGGLLLALSLRIGKSVLYYFGEQTDLLVLQVGLSAAVFIGPFFYLYAKALYEQSRRFKQADLALLLILFIAIAGVGWLFPYRVYPEVWNGPIVYGIYGLWFLFTLCGLYYCHKILRGVLTSARPMNRSQQYLTAIVIALLAITFTYQSALLGGFTYIWGSLIFSFAFYYLLGRTLLTTRFLSPQPPPSPVENGPELLKKVNTLMVTRKPFTNQGLKLDELAAQTNMTRHTLSRLLNEEYSHGFSQYVKEYRVREAQRLIATRPELSLEGIGYEAGFRSKSAFFEAFKKVVSCTPAEYKKSQKQEA